MGRGTRDGGVGGRAAPVGGFPRPRRGDPLLAGSAAGALPLRSRQPGPARGRNRGARAAAAAGGRGRFPPLHGGDRGQEAAGAQRGRPARRASAGRARGAARVGTLGRAGGLRAARGGGAARSGTASRRAGRALRQPRVREAPPGVGGAPRALRRAAAVRPRRRGGAGEDDRGGLGPLGALARRPGAALPGGGAFARSCSTSSTCCSR